MKPILTGLCGLLAGAILMLAATEPRTHATPQPANHVVDTNKLVPEATVIAPSIEAVEEPETAPPLVPSVTQDAIALAPATGDCPNGVCSQPRAIVRQRVTVQKPQRRGLFGGRFRR